VATPRSTAEFYRSQQRLAVLTISATRRAWARMGRDFDRSWAEVGPRLVVLASAAQLTAARQGAAYVPDVLAETGQPDDPVGVVNPRGFAGTAADGRTLDWLLYGAVTHSKEAVAAGQPPSSALASGGRWLDMVAQGIVADAGRASTSVGIAARPQIGWVRMVNPPCCGRCAILAGKFYRFSQGFQRHPRCDCTHIPSTEDMAGDFRTDPTALARSGQITDLRPAEAAALREGADLSQLVNARRGRAGLGGMYTTAGTSRRGLAGRRLNGQRRLTPEAIYARAGADRAEAVRLLREHAYLL
jgi:hypothetical protein